MKQSVILRVASEGSTMILASIPDETDFERLLQQCEHFSDTRVASILRLQRQTNAFTYPTFDVESVHSFMFDLEEIEPVHFALFRGSKMRACTMDWLLEFRVMVIGSLCTSPWGIDRRRDGWLLHIAWSSVIWLLLTRLKRKVSWTIRDEESKLWASVCVGRDLQHLFDFFKEAVAQSDSCSHTVSYAASIAIANTACREFSDEVQFPKPDPLAICTAVAEYLSQKEETEAK